MIRRDICLPDGAPGWMLISQVEHARVSGELAAHCNGCFAAPSQPSQRASGAGSSPTPTRVRDEVLAAITHHDDGWREWERSPALDPKHGRPLAFTEIASDDAMTIWSRSIDAAAAIGPLAASMVAGHFLRLAGHSEDLQGDAQFQTWKSDMESRRDDWLAAWQRADSLAHTRSLADEALQWLWTFDEASLWLCCSCTMVEPIPCAPEPYRSGRGTPIEMELRATGAEAAVAAPWRFTRTGLRAEVSGQVLPAAPYCTAAELLAASVPAVLIWQLSPQEKDRETPPEGRS